MDKRVDGVERKAAEMDSHGDDKAPPPPAHDEGGTPGRDHSSQAAPPSAPPSSKDTNTKEISKLTGSMLPSLIMLLLTFISEKGAQTGSNWILELFDSWKHAWDVRRFFAMMCMEMSRSEKPREHVFMGNRTITHAEKEEYRKKELELVRQTMRCSLSWPKPTREQKERLERKRVAAYNGIVALMQCSKAALYMDDHAVLCMTAAASFAMLYSPEIGRRCRGQAVQSADRRTKTQAIWSHYLDALNDPVQYLTTLADSQADISFHIPDDDQRHPGMDASAVTRNSARAYPRAKASAAESAATVVGSDHNAAAPPAGNLGEAELSAAEASATALAALRGEAPSASVCALQSSCTTDANVVVAAKVPATGAGDPVAGVAAPAVDASAAEFGATTAAAGTDIDVAAASCASEQTSDEFGVHNQRKRRHKRSSTTPKRRRQQTQTPYEINDEDEDEDEDEDGDEDSDDSCVYDTAVSACFQHSVGGDGYLSTSSVPGIAEGSATVLAASPPWTSNRLVQSRVREGGVADILESKARSSSIETQSPTQPFHVPLESGRARFRVDQSDIAFASLRIGTDQARAMAVRMNELEETPCPATWLPGTHLLSRESLETHLGMNLAPNFLYDRLRADSAFCTLWSELHALQNEFLETERENISADRFLDRIETLVAGREVGPESVKDLRDLWDANVQRLPSREYICVIRPQVPEELRLHNMATLLRSNAHVADDDAAVEIEHHLHGAETDDGRPTAEVIEGDGVSWTKSLRYCPRNRTSTDFARKILDVAKIVVVENMAHAGITIPCADHGAVRSLQRNIQHILEQTERVQALAAQLRQNESEVRHKLKRLLLLRNLIFDQVWDEKGSELLASLADTCQSLVCDRKHAPQRVLRWLETAQRCERARCARRDLHASIRVHLREVAVRLASEMHALLLNVATRETAKLHVSRVVDRLIWLGETAFEFTTLDLDEVRRIPRVTADEGQAALDRLFSLFCKARVDAGESDDRVMLFFEPWNCRAILFAVRCRWKHEPPQTTANFLQQLTAPRYQNCYAECVFEMCASDEPASYDDARTQQTVIDRPEEEFALALGSEGVEARDNLSERLRAAGYPDSSDVMVSLRSPATNLWGLQPQCPTLP